MSRDRLSQVLKVLPLVQLIAGLVTGAATAVATVAIYKTNVDNEIAAIKEKNVVQDRAIDRQQSDHDLLIQIDTNVRMLMKAADGTRR